MTREEVIDAASKNLSGLRKKLRRHVRGISDTMIEDCCQEAFLWVLEHVAALQQEVGLTSDGGKVILKQMANASGRYIRAARKAVGSVSLNNPLSDEEGSAELGDLVIDASTLDYERVADSHRAAEAMILLGTQEARILMDFADDVPIEEIALEHELTVPEVLMIKLGAAEKIKAHAFARVMAKSVLRPLKALDLSKHGSAQ